MTNRARYIRDTYTFTLEGDEWVARETHRGVLKGEFRGADKAAVRRKAGAYWGHFNFHDEIVAFNEIFRS